MPAAQIGIASGANSALREVGGVFGVAVLASVFSGPRVYASHSAFVAGFSAALWVAVGFSALGVLAALLSSERSRKSPSPEPVVRPVAQANPAAELASAGSPAA